MDLIPRSKWNARSPKFRIEGDLHDVSTCHWNGPTITVGGKLTWDHSKCASLVRGIQNYHMDVRGWSDIAYNFVVCPHGDTFAGRGLDVNNGANGTRVGNTTSHTVMCLSGVSNPFTEVEKHGFKDCIKYVSDRTAAPNKCKGHRDWHSTECPGDERYKWVHAGMPIVEPSKPIPPFDPDHGHYSLYPLNPHKALIKLGSKGDLVSYAQGVIKNKAGGDITINGVFDSQTRKRTRDLQRYFGFSKREQDGIIGPHTWKLIDWITTL